MSKKISTSRHATFGAAFLKRICRYLQISAPTIPYVLFEIPWTNQTAGNPHSTSKNRKKTSPSSKRSHFETIALADDLGVLLNDHWADSGHLFESSVRVQYHPWALSALN
jgi:hypothetical protein